MPIERARVDFFLQGATVSAGPVLISDGSTGSVYVYEVGALVVGHEIRAGLGGPPLSVTAIDLASHQVTLSNASGDDVTLDAGIRLIDVSSRPTAYADELGKYSLGSGIYSDSSGRATAFLDVSVCDYVVASDPPSPDSSSTATKNNTTGSTMTWNHSATGEERLVLVAISWQESSDSETLDEVKYDGVAMTPLVSSSKLGLYALTDPPTGSKSIVATWSGTGAKGAVGGAIGFAGVNPEIGLGMARQDSSTGTAASVGLDGTVSNSVLLGALAVNASAGSVTPVTPAGMKELWNLSAGTTGATNLTKGVGATMPGEWAEQTLMWSWPSGSRPWETAAVEIRPSFLRLYSDQTGTGCNGREFGLNATFYATLQQAIDALPAKGGVLYLPAGTYRLREGIVINKPNVTLIGEGDTTVITADDPENLPINLLTVSAELTRLSRLKFDAGASDQNLEDGVCCIVMLGLGASSRPDPLCHLEDVTLTGASKYGLWMQDVISFIGINCNVFENKGTGLRIEGTPDGGSTVGIRFYSSNFSYNDVIGADVGTPYPPLTGVVAITFFACVFEGNKALDISDLSTVGTGLNVHSTAKLEILSSYFENAPTGAKQFLRLESCFTTTVDNCWFEGGTENQPERGAWLNHCPFSRITNNSFEGFTQDIITFEGDCSASVEFGNRDMGFYHVPPVVVDLPRIVITDRGIVGMSRRAVGLPSLAAEANLPDSGTDPAPGSLAWVDSPGSGKSKLRVWDGSLWKSISFS